MSQKLLLLIMTVLAATIITVFLVVLLPDSALDKSEELTQIPNTITEPLVSFIDPVRGNNDASVTIVEYGDYTCALCKSIESDLRQVIADAPRKRRLVWKDAPNIDVHPESMPAAIAARCAQDQSSFWGYHDALLAEPVIPTAERLESISEELGLNTETFLNCMASEVTRPIVLHTLEEAVALGVTGTPTLFINGEEYNGAMTLEALTTAIKAL